MAQHFLSVNGETLEVDCDSSSPLLYVLRNDLGLVGSKFGCGLGLCGACMIWYDGSPVYSCDIPVEYAVGHEIVTVEGIGSEASPHPLQTALIERQAVQCGYCISGILMTGAAHLRDNAQTDRAAVAAALDRNLCRCGTHSRIVDAVLDVAGRARACE